MAGVDAIGYAGVLSGNVGATGSMVNATQKAGNQFDSFLKGNSSTSGEEVSVKKNSKLEKTSDDRKDTPLRKNNLISKERDSVECEGPIGETGELKEVLDEVNVRIRSELKETLGISDEELDALLESMGICLTDLLQPEVLQQFVLTANGSQEPTDLLTDENMMSQWNYLMEEFNELVDVKLADVLGQMEALETPVSLEEFLGGQLEDAQTEDVVLAEDVVVQDGQTDQMTGEIMDDAVQNPTSGAKDVDFANVNGDSVENLVISKEEQNDSRALGEMSNHGDMNESNSESTLFSNQNLKEADVASENVMTSGTQILQGNVEKLFDTSMQGAQKMQQMIDIVNQVSEQIKSSVTRETTTMEMQLNPESLGKVHLSVVSKEGVMTATFRVETDEARHALESQIMTLRDNLEAKNLKVESVEVHVSDFDFSQSNGAEKQNQQQAEKQGKRRFHYDTVEEESLESIQEEERRVRESIMRDTGGSVDFTA